MTTSFWETFLLLLIFLPLAMAWGFALVDIFRRPDLTGAWKALWTLVVFVLPFLGTLIYLVARPQDPGRAEREALEQAEHEVVPHFASDPRSTQLLLLSELHDRGSLSDEEFAAEKARIVGSPTAPQAAGS